MSDICDGIKRVRRFRYGSAWPSWSPLATVEGKRFSELMPSDEPATEPYWAKALTER